MSDVQADAAPASSEPTAPVVETVQYADGTSATGVAPLPELSPAEQFAADASKVAQDFVGLSGDVGRLLVDAAHPALVHLQAIEQIAILWGGDVGVQLRELVAKAAAAL